MRTRVFPSGSRPAFTLIELLVVIGVIGVLAGLLLPAVQAAREAARRARCAKNLGQIMLSVHTFEAARGGAPPSQFWGRIRNARVDPIGLYSLQCRLLPFLEQGHLHDLINFHSPLGGTSGLELFHLTAATRSIAPFLCPSDPGVASGPFASNYYRACTGLGETRKQDDGAYRLIFDGAFAPIDDRGGSRAALPLSAIRDGLSNTLGFSEKPVGSGSTGAYSPFRDWAARDLGDDTPSADQWVDACSRLADAAPRLDAGASWMLPGAIYTHFYASVPPGSPVPHCGTSAPNFGLGIYAARSYHPGGVNAAMLDGSVRWFSSGTSTMLWRGLGTRDGGELVVE